MEQERDSGNPPMAPDGPMDRSDAGSRLSVPHPQEATAASPPVVSSEALLGGGRELLIRHGSEAYRLRLTGNNKLILTK